jgi:hypothetical protein
MISRMAKSEYSPAVWATAQVEEGVFLLETKPGLVDGMGLHQLGALVAVVKLVGGAIVVPALGEDNDVWRESDRVGEDGNGPEVHVRVLAGSLARGGAVKVPYRKVLRSPLLLFEGLAGRRLVHIQPEGGTAIKLGARFRIPVGLRE